MPTHLKQMMKGIKMPIKNIKFDNEEIAIEKLYDMMPAKDIIAKKPLIVCSSLASVFQCDYLAKKLRLNYEIIFSESIFSPVNPECLIAMVSETQDIVIIEELRKSFGITLDYIYGESNRAYEEKILKNLYKYRKGKLIEDLGGRNILLVDRGCDSGMTALINVKSLLNLGVKSIEYVTPIISREARKKISVLVDEIYSLQTISDFVDVDFYYESKSQVGVDEILESSPYYLPLKKQGESCAI